MKTHILWLILIVVDILIAGWFLFCSYGVVFNEFAPDIIGTFLGIFGAISLEEMIRTYKSDKDLEQELTRLLEEVLKLASEFAPGTHYFVFNPQWKKLRSTEFIDYIGNKSHRYFELLDTHIEHHNDLVKQSTLRVLDENDVEQVVDYTHELDGDAYEVCQFILGNLYPEYLDKLDLGHFEDLHPNKTVEEIQTITHSMWKKRNI